MSDAQREPGARHILELEQRAVRWEQRYHRLLAELTDAVYLHDATGAVVSVNPAAERLSGFTREEVLRMNIRDLFSPDLSRQAETGVREYSTTCEAVTRGGDRLPVFVHGTVLFEPGEPLVIQCIARESLPPRRAE